MQSITFEQSNSSLYLKNTFHMHNTQTGTLKFEQTIGSGTFGKVKRALHIPTNQKVAVKILNKHQIETKKDALRIKRQITILKTLNHPNLLKLLQLIETQQSYLLVTRLIEGQQLYQLINRRGAMDEHEAGELFVQLLDAMMHLKRKRVVHRDIKPENIIVANRKVTLIDFGLGCLCDEGERLKTSCGSPCYAAPEMMSGKSYDPQKTEIWALGVTLYAMLSGNLPFDDGDPNQLYKQMMANRYEQPPKISSQLKELLRGMIESRPSKRLSLEKIVEHRWVKAQQYEFVDQKALAKWDQRLLAKMMKELGCERQVLLQKIQTNFGQQSITYWLCAGQPLQNYELASHNGPIHLRYIFKSINLALQFIQKQYPQSSKLAQYKYLSSSQTIEIRKIGGGLFYVSIV